MYSKDRIDKNVAELLSALRAIVAECDDQLAKSEGMCASIRSLFSCCHGECLFHEPK